MFPGHSFPQMQLAGTSEKFFSKGLGEEAELGFEIVVEASSPLLQKVGGVAGSRV